MTSSDIYTTLSSKSNNAHYLNRYWKFIQSLKHQTKIDGITENHHICPKAKDLFPEYKSLQKHHWNSIHLSRRQHWVAHWLLAKAYGNSQTIAFFRMTKKSENRITSSIYEQFRIEVNMLISKTNSKPNPKTSEFRKGKVSCYDTQGNPLLISKEEFYSREDVCGISKGNNSDYTRTEEYRRKISNYKKDNVWLFHPDNEIIHFTHPNDLEHYLTLGFIIGHKIVPYDRKKHTKICPHCNISLDSANYSK